MNKGTGKKISGSEYPLAKIFSSEFEYIIPSYQRPYAWTTDQASELFDDLYDFFITEKDDGYFLGSIVLIKQENHPHSEVIDGQQRLTTLTILIASLASKMNITDRNTLCKYIVEPGNKFEGLEAKPRLTLRERDNNFFSAFIQSLHFDDLLSIPPESLANESQQNIQANSRLFLDRIANRFSDNNDFLQKFVAFLLQRCFLVAVATPSQQSAFRVFSVMNSRGLDLQPTDIIKADIIGKINESKQDEFNERWENLEVELGRSGFNDLFAYIRMIFAKEKAKKALLDEFRIQVLPNVPHPQELIVNILEPYGEALRVIRNGNYKSTNDAQKINHFLQWLGRIDNSDWIPPSLLFYSQHKNDSVYASWFFERMERLAAYLHICSKNVNERIERYAMIINELESEHSVNDPINTIELTDSEITEFRSRLNENIYYITARRRNYIILRLDSFMSDGAASYDSNILTIEHVLPQTVPDDSEWSKIWTDTEQRSVWVHKLANLVPLNKRRNSAAQNYDFESKKKAYFSGKNNVSSYVITTQVLAETSWTPEVVAKRQSELLDVFNKSWRLDHI